MLADTNIKVMLDTFMTKRKHFSKHPSTGREKEGPRKDGALWIYGLHAATAAVANPRRRCLRIIAAEQGEHGVETGLAEAAEACAAERPALEIRDRRELDQILPRDAVHQGAAALVAPLPETALEDVLLNAEGQKDAVVVILDQATDPRNIGSVLRSAAAFGALAVIVQDRHSPEATASMAKAAAGALEAVPLVRVTNLARAMGALKQAEFWCIGMAAHADKTISEAGLTGRLALVFGAEGSGLRRLTAETCDLLVRVPIASAVESLNLSNAAAIALYELRRNLPKG